eukprot:6298186-Amphidinium_carterae.1
MTRHAIRRIVKEYAELFYWRTIKSKPPMLDYPNDLLVPQTAYEDIVLSMNSDVRVIIGIDAIDQGEEKRWFATGLGTLRREVLQGHSTVIVDGLGEVLRLACIVVLRVTHHNSKVLVQLAKYDVEAEESMQVKCQLPAVKQVDNESWPEAAERLLLSMRNVVGSVDLSTSTQEIECKHSQGVGVRTKYLRTTCVGHMTATPEELNQRGRPGGRSVIKRSLLPYQSTQPVKVQKVDCPNAFGLNDEEVYITGRNGK